MASKRALQFPTGFLWGNATASHQCEGGNTNNQWHRWEQQGHILSGESCGAACDWWQQAEGDFELAEQMENNALRLSLEWSRIEPEEGRWDSAAIERYRALLRDLRRRHMTPVVTLHHFTEPLWFAHRGGFADAANIALFTRYIKYVSAQLQDLCDFWVTLNEPNVYAAMGYLLGSFPPGEHSVRRAALVLRNMLQAHVEAFYAISEQQPEARIGYCLHYRLFDPARYSGCLTWLAPLCTTNFLTGQFLKLLKPGGSLSRSSLCWNRSNARLTPAIITESTITRVKWCILMSRGQVTSFCVAFIGQEE